VKANGGTDSLGTKWKPLSRATIAARPVRKGEVGRFGIGGRGSKAFKNRTRGLLTPEQDNLWKGIFASTVKRLMVTLGEREAKSKAAETAWAILKSKGAKTRLGTLGGRDVQILVNTGRLLTSYSPGRVSGGSYTPPSGDQTVIFHDFGIRITFSVPYGDATEATRPVLPPAASSWVSDAFLATMVEFGIK